jgi:hypothetical protein
MGWGGFEVLVKSLCFSPRKGGLKPEMVDLVLTPLVLPVFRPTCPPKRRLKKLEAWLDRGATADRHTILAFLGLDRGDAAIVESWLIQGQPTACWAESVRLAKAIRNCSAHGALSAAKVREWGLRPACCQLVCDLATVTVSVISHLAQT